MPWYLFYGRMLHMSRREVLCTRVGEMVDMIACLAIYNGAAEEKPPKRKMDFAEAITWR